MPTKAVSLLNVRFGQSFRSVNATLTSPKLLLNLSHPPVRYFTAVFSVFSRVRRCPAACMRTPAVTTLRLRVCPRWPAGVRPPLPRPSRSASAGSLRQPAPAAPGRPTRRTVGQGRLRGDGYGVDRGGTRRERSRGGKGSGLSQGGGAGEGRGRAGEDRGRPARFCRTVRL